MFRSRSDAGCSDLLRKKTKKLICKHLIWQISYSCLVIPLRFERRTHALEGRCSIQLSYGTILICVCKGSLFMVNSKVLESIFLILVLNIL